MRNSLKISNGVKKFIVLSLVGILGFGFVIGQVNAFTSPRIGATGGNDISLFKISGGASPYVDFSVSTWTLGNTTNRIANGFFTSLTAGTFVVDTAVSGNLAMGGYNITNAGLITGTYFNATSTSATSTLSGGLAIETSGLVYDRQTNNVGIGTAAPASLLTLSGGSLSWSSGVAMTAGNYEIARNTDAVNRLQYNVPTGAVHELSINNVSFLEINASGIVVQTGGNSILTVNGTSDYGSFLYFNQSGTNYYQIKVDSPSDDFIIQSTDIDGAGTDGSILRNDLGTQDIWLYGKLGIGTTTPNWLLQLANAGTLPQFVLTDTSGGSNLKHMYASSTLGALAFGELNDSLTTYTERMRIDASGKVGIGTTTPATKLQVSSGASATTTITCGELGDTTSKCCINVNQADGTAGSFYFANGALVVENNACK